MDAISEAKSAAIREHIDGTRPIKYTYPMHDHDYKLDLDGQVTCSICGAMDDEMVTDIFETQRDFE